MDCPYAFDKVWDAACTVFERSEWGIKKADRAAGTFEVMVSQGLGLKIGRWMEKFQVDLTRVDENLTRIHTGIRTQRLHWGTTRQHIDSFLIELGKILEQS